MQGRPLPQFGRAGQAAKPGRGGVKHGHPGLLGGTAVAREARSPLMLRRRIGAMGCERPAPFAARAQIEHAHPSAGF